MSAATALLERHDGEEAEGGPEVMPTPVKAANFIYEPELFQALLRAVSHVSGLSVTPVFDAPTATSGPPPCAASTPSWLHTADLFVMCSPPAVRSRDSLEIIAAPLLRHQPGGRPPSPVYHSEVVVRADSDAATLADLRGGCVAINDLASLSGHHVWRLWMKATGQTTPFFARAVATGGHARSAALVADGAVDCAAIDCQTLKRLTASHPDLVASLRCLPREGSPAELLSPIQPWLVRRDLPPAVKTRLVDAFKALGGAAAGTASVAAALEATDVAGFETDPAVLSSLYDSICTKLQAAETVSIAVDVAKADRDAAPGGCPKPAVDAADAAP